MQVSSVNPMHSALMYLTPSSTDVGVHHMFPQMTLLPPSAVLAIFSKTRTFAPASEAATAAESPAKPVPKTTTSASRAHSEGNVAEVAHSE